MRCLLSKRVVCALFCLAGGVAVQAQVTYTAGDILVGFQASGGDGTGNNFVYNLGHGHSFRSATTTITVGNIGTNLGGIYGTDWFTRTDLQWAIAGVRTNASFGPDATAVINGDPARTVYISKGATGLGTSSPHGTLSPSSVTSGATKMMDMQSGFRTTNGTLDRTPIAGTGGRAVNQGTGDINSWNAVVTSTPFTVYTGSVKQAFGTVGTLSYLDLYRCLGRNDLSGIVETADVGVHVFQGTFTIDATGEIKFVPPTATATAYETWADSFNLVGADRNFESDPDKDGIKNGLEFVIGDHPKNGIDPTKLPTMTHTGASVQFVFRRTDGSAYLNPKAEYDADLLGTWSPANDGSGGVTVVAVNDGFGAGVDRVTVTIPVSGEELFARLRVSQ